MVEQLKELPVAEYHKQQVLHHFEDSSLKEVHIPANAPVANERCKTLSFCCQSCQQIINLIEKINTNKEVPEHFIQDNFFPKNPFSQNHMIRGIVQSVHI